MKRAIAFIAIGALSSPMNFKGRAPKDVFPLYKTLNYQYLEESRVNNPAKLLEGIVKSLDVENNPRYKKVGVAYKNNKAYEIPIHEIRDFDINSKHTNTYCNIFTIDVLNIIDNTLNTGRYKISNTSILANDIRNLLEKSKEWEEIPKHQASTEVDNGNIVLLSYVKKPHGHVAFVNNNSNANEIYLWNVGATNGNNVKWHINSNTKYFKKVKYL